MGLDHPNIEWFLEAGRLFDGRLYAVSTYTSGIGLDEILAGSRRLVLERAAHTIESAGEALGRPIRERSYTAEYRRKTSSLRPSNMRPKAYGLRVLVSSGRRGPPTIALRTTKRKALRTPLRN